MSIWSQYGVLEKVCDALGDVTIANPGGHHFGRPFMTAYQLAIKLDRDHPDVARALGLEVGGNGTGSRNSLAQYLARELSRRINRHGEDFPVEGAFLSNDHVTALAFSTSDGKALSSSLTNTGFDVSLFRLRTPRS
ncbi:hypothetical protein [Saccharothrix longispora]|uniref:hypothetical protein n=1 Tax=Saccharothrix longispora TaxID=33920 RepID=UPI0028FDA15D|nr:hypothetical protein [Saccharothrix longispora]MBY8852740.1 hypothetical protein [Saccharothrix sp. MB29]MDU0294376.1 hypothetical protein [Saccharothrix longispora]